jgi:hypothetical protein
MMKKIIVLACILGTFQFTYAQEGALDQFFKTYLDDPSFTVVNISPKMFQLFSEMDMEGVDSETKEVISNIKSLRVLTRETDGLKYFQEANKKLTSNQFEEILSVREKDNENVRILIKESGNYINELVLLVGGEDEFVLLDLVGRIDLKTIGKLGSKIEAPGLEHLNRVDH